MNRKEDTGDLFGAIARLAEVSKKLGVPVPKLDLKSRHRAPIPHCCPVCGGNWEGDGFTTPIHCERIECPQDREPDADPLPCEIEQLKFAPANGNPRAFIGIHEGCGGWKPVLYRWNPGCGGFYEPYNSGVDNTLGDGTRESAIVEASAWAVSEGLPFWAPKE